jgi:hypothetical protein
VMAMSHGYVNVMAMSHGYVNVMAMSHGYVNVMAMSQTIYFHKYMYFTANISNPWISWKFFLRLIEFQITSFHRIFNLYGTKNRNILLQHTNFIAKNNDYVQDP